jgi:hypothetical protein
VTVRVLKLGDDDATNSAVIPGMNAIAFTREVLAVFGEPRRMLFIAVLCGHPSRLARARTSG